MRKTTLAVALLALGCGGAVGGGETTTTPTTPPPPEAPPPPPEPVVTTLGSLPGGIVSAFPAGMDAWSVSSWATVFRSWRVPVGGGQPSPFPALPAEADLAAGTWVGPWVIPSPQGARVAFQVGTDSMGTTHVRNMDGTGDRTLEGRLPIGWTADGSELVVLEPSQHYAPLTKVVALPMGDGEPRILHEAPSDRILGYGGAVSPDGTKVVFVSMPAARRAASDLFVVSISGGEARPLTSDGLENAAPAFTTDGRGVLHTSRRGGPVDLWVVPIDGGDPVAVLEAPGIESAPAMSRDGRFLLFGWRDETPSVVTIRSLPAGTVRTLPGTVDDVVDVAVSPDGMSVLYARGMSGETDLFLQSLAGGEPRAIVTGAGADLSPAFSPDNNTIAYVSTREGTPDIYIVPVAGGGARRVTEGSGVVPGTDLVFSPDVRSLLFTRLRDSVPVLTLLPLGGGTPIDLAEHATSYAFDPDGRTVLAGVAVGERMEYRRIKVDGTGTPEVLALDVRGGHLLHVEGRRNRQKALVIQDTDRVRLLRVDMSRGETETLAELAENVDHRRLSWAVSPNGSTLATTEALITSEVRRLDNAGEILSSLLR